MYDQLEDIVSHRRFLPTQRKYPISRLHQCYAVEPWEKNTIEIQLSQKDLPRQTKTFYHAPAFKTPERQISTQREFRLNKTAQSRMLSKPKSFAEASRKSAISHYNISGNILGQALKAIPKSLPFQLPPKKIRHLRSKQKSNKSFMSESQPFAACESVMAIKRKLSEKKQSLDEGFIKLNNENVGEPPRIQFNMKRSKVIRLGFQKLNHFRGFSRQKSLQLPSGSIMA